MVVSIKVDLDTKENLVVQKNIRQSTSKILQRPSAFQSPRNSQSLITKEKTLIDELKAKQRERISDEDRYSDLFDQQFQESFRQSTFHQQDIESQFEAIQGEFKSELTQNLKPSLKKLSNDSKISQILIPPLRKKNYFSSNLARDRKLKPPNKHTTATTRVIEPLSNLYEDISDFRNSPVESKVEGLTANIEEQCKHDRKSTKNQPFMALQNCLFSVFTKCVPWCIMRKIYWKNK